MPRKTKIQGMDRSSTKKQRGRTTGATKSADPFNPTGSNPVPQTARREVSRPMTAGGGKHRGNRRDTSPTYTGSRKEASRTNPRPDVKTRKR